jgi:tetratricopeptide (TPR) repeat protein
LPENIGVLSRLQIINLEGCSLEVLPDSIGDLASLRTLGLRGNRLASLPASIGKLRELRALSVSENRLVDLPDTIGDLANLRELVLFDNCLVSLPSTIGGLKGVQQLVLARNKLESLPEEFGAMVSLKECYLSENKLTRLPGSIGSLGNLRKLVLDDNPLDESSVRLAKSLASSGCVVSIRQSNEILSRMARMEENPEAVLENPTAEDIFTGVKAVFTRLIPYFEGVEAIYEEDFCLSTVKLSNIRTSDAGIEAVVTFLSGYEEPGSEWNFSCEWDRMLYTASKWFFLNVGTFTFRNSEMKNYARVSRSLDEANRLMGWDETIARIDKPMNSEYWGRVGVEYMKAGKFVEAEDALKKSVELEPESAAAWGRLVVFFNNRGRKEEALDAVDNALRFAPADWPGVAVMEKYRQELSA